MVFNSTEFALFFLVFMIAYSLVWKYIFLRNVLIIIASYVFYGSWDVRFLILVALSTSSDYCAALGASGQSVSLTDRVKSGGFLVAVAALAVVIARRDLWLLWTTSAAVTVFVATHWAPLKMSEPHRRKAWLIFSLSINFGLLFFFKYFNFFVAEATELLRWLGLGAFHVGLKFVLPIGLSFFTFQATGRTIDSYLGKYSPSKNLVNYAAFHAFFPQLVAGPIERAGHLMPQFESVRPMDPGLAARGSLLFLWGLFKKVVIADNMSLLVAQAFGDNAGEVSSATAFIAILAFTFQIYGDFSGYSDMARGVANIMGFDLFRNFDIPYCARTPSEFWRRWHISLSQWLRDYIFIPLGGSRGTEMRTYLNIMITMVLGGIWHGASWTFAFWGFYHGAIQVIFRFFRLEKLLTNADNSGALLRVATHIALWALTMSLVMIGWVFFRAATFSQAAHILGAVAIWREGPPDLTPLLRIVWPLLVVEIAEIWVKRKDVYLALPPFLQFNFGLASFLAVLTVGSYGGQQFIYFNF